MDVMVEISVAALSRLLAERLSKERIVFDAQVPIGGDTWVFDHAAVGGLTLRAMAQPATIMVPTAGGTIAPVPITGQRVRATLNMRLHFATLRAIANLATNGTPSTVQFVIPISMDLGLSAAGSSVQLSLASPTVDLSALPIDAADRMRFQMQADAQIAGLLSQIASSFDLAPLGAITGGSVDIANVGLAVDGLTGSATFLQLAVQLRSAPASSMSAAAAAATVTRWTRFFATPSSVRGRSDWAVAVDGSLVARGTASTLSAGLASSPQLQMRGAVTGRWLAADGSHPAPRIRIDAPVRVLNACGAGHSLDADVHVDATFVVPRTNIVELDAHVSHDVDFLSQLGCEFQIAFLGAGAGFVIGGVFGGWIGAIVGAVVGFVVGFVATAIAIAVINPALPGVAGCRQGATDQDLVCEQPFSVGGGDLFAGLTAEGTASTATALVITGQARVAAGAPALTSCVVSDRWVWQRLPDGSGHAAVTEVRVTNIGGHTVLFGPVSWQGDGRELWEPYLSAMTRAPLRSGERTTLRIVIPKTAVDAARAAGNLHPPSVLFFTTGGARLATWTTVPDDVSEVALDQADALYDLLERVRAAEYALRGVVFRPFPPDPRTNISDAAILIARLPEAKGKLVPTVIDTAGNVVQGTVERTNGAAVLRTIVRDTSADQLFVAALPADASGEKLASAVKDRLRQLDQSGADWAKVEGALDQAVADHTATVTIPLPSGTQIDVTRADLTKLAKLVDTLTAKHSPAKELPRARFGVVSLSVSEMELGQGASITESDLGPLAVDVRSGPSRRTISLAGTEPIQSAVEDAEKKVANKDEDRIVGGRMVQLIREGDRTTMQLLTPVSRVETPF